MARKFVISIPVADLRNRPEKILADDYSHQELRESQLLFGEKLSLLVQQGEWLQVAALEQPCFDPQKGWHPYEGWIHFAEAQEVENFSPLNLPKIPNRTLLVDDAHQFVGAPYLWGGRSFPLSFPISSVDCSGLVNLLYRRQGVIIPRNAHDQYLRCKPTAHLQPGDPLYLAKEKKINHVVLKLDPVTFIEAPETGKSVRLLTWGTHIWEEGGKIRIFDRPHPYTPYPGTFT